jgi:metal-sulfur cluster biosynthetic enzyme
VKHPESLRQDILERLSKVIDPETGADVVRMRLIENLEIDENGHVSYVFRPSSPFCPIAIPLSVSIKNAISEVEGVTGQTFDIAGFAFADEMLTWFRENFPEHDPGQNT